MWEAKQNVNLTACDELDFSIANPKLGLVYSIMSGLRVNAV